MTSNDKLGVVWIRQRTLVSDQRCWSLLVPRSWIGAVGPGHTGVGTLVRSVVQANVASPFGDYHKFLFRDRHGGIHTVPLMKKRDAMAYVVALARMGAL